MVFILFIDYVSRMRPEQKEIYYLIVPSRQFAEQSPYFESFKAADVEVRSRFPFMLCSWLKVLFLFDTRLDDFVMSNLGEYKGKKVKTIESSSAAETISKMDKVSRESNVKMRWLFIS